MTVQELIDELSKHEPLKPVWIDVRGLWLDILSIQPQPEGQIVLSSEE